MTWNIFQGCAQIWIDQWLNNSWEIDLKFTSDRLWLHLMANGLWSILRSILISFTTFHILSMVDVWKNVLVSFLRQTFTKGDIKYIFKSNVWKPTLYLTFQLWTWKWWDFFRQHIYTASDVEKLRIFSAT